MFQAASSQSSGSIPRSFSSFSAKSRPGFRCPVSQRLTTAVSVPSWRASSFCVQPRFSSAARKAATALGVLAMRSLILTIGSAVNVQPARPLTAPLPFDSMTARSAQRPAVDKPESELWGRLKQALEHARITQTQLETRLVAAGITSKGYLSRMRYGERGSKKGPAPELIEGIADICGVDFHWLFTGRGDMLPARTPPILKTTKPTKVPPSRIVSRT